MTRLHQDYRSPNPREEEGLPGPSEAGDALAGAPLRRALGPWADELLSLVGDAVISTDGEGTVILFNEAAEEMFGYDSEEMHGKAIERLMPVRSRDVHRQAVSRFGTSAAEARRSMGRRREIVGLRKNGEEFPAEAILSRRAIGGQQVLTVAVRDVSERRAIEEERRLVAKELAHRFKNCLAVVNAVVSLSARGAATVEVFHERLRGRLKAIANTQDALLRDGATGAPLKTLIEAELEPFARGERVQISLSGPAVSIPAKSALRLTLALHELATNAAKYGALSKAGGSLAIRWRTERQGRGEIMILDWTEAEGPVVGRDSRRGFGSELIERCLGAANVKLDLRSSGLEAELRLAID